MRRDGLGSMWFSDEERKIVADMYGKALLVGESCYWGCSSDDCTPFASDTRYRMETWRDVYEQTFQHAIEGHFNTLDLRELPETKGWTERANDLVEKFIVQGGYRIYPYSVSLPVRAKSNSTVTISHEWKNTGNGYLPNNMPNWNYKYKPAFALFDQQGNPVQTWVDDNAEPSDWLHNAVHSYTYPVTFTDIPEGTYQWAVAIVDQTKNQQPGIKLAIKDKKEKEGWVLLNDIVIQ